MPSSNTLSDSQVFNDLLFEKLKSISPCVGELEPYEFQYCLKDLLPSGGWESVWLEPMTEIEARVNDRSFYDRVQIRVRIQDRLVLDTEIIRLAQMLFVGLVTQDYPLDWVEAHFFFDPRGFYFLHRTTYFTGKILKHLSGKPYRQYEQKQKHFDEQMEIGYKAFREANANVDEEFIRIVMNLIRARGTPILIAIAGPTAAGKTEIVERLTKTFHQAGQKVASIEVDNFLTDRDYREARGIDSQGRAAIHFELFKQSLEDISRGIKISIPRYDFIYATSSHDLDGHLKADGVPFEIEPADIVFIEGNFPFLIEEVAPLIGIKVVYLTDDPIRLKRKWRRDIDYRKKYDPSYFRNRFFKEQFIMAQIAYLPQMEICDMVVDTTGAALWVTPEIAALLDRT